MTPSKRSLPTYTNQPSLDMELALNNSNNLNGGMVDDDDPFASVEAGTTMETVGLLDDPTTANNNNGSADLMDDSSKHSKHQNDSTAAAFSLVGTASTGWRRHMNLVEVSAVATYSFCSISMILVNKSLASRYVLYCIVCCE